jgi:hypothetical protein
MNEEGGIMLNHKSYHWIFFLILCLIIGICAGCASFKEKFRGFMGVSTKVLEESRQDAITRAFNFDYNTCYDKVKAALKQTESYIYSEDKAKHMIAVYVSASDTTPVGLFFRDVDANNTEIQVSSPSTNAKEFVSKNVFSVLDGTYKSKLEKGKPDENK